MSKPEAARGQSKAVDVAAAADFDWPQWPEGSETPPTATAKPIRKPPPATADGDDADVGGPTGSISASIERRRQARQRSSFDDVEAAIAAVRTAPTNGAAGLSDHPFDDVSAGAESGTGQGRLQAGSPQHHYDGANASAGYAANGLEADPHSPFDADEGFVDQKSAGRAAAMIGWVALVAALVGLTSFAYLGAETVIRKLPGSATLYAMLGVPTNVRGLEFKTLDYHWQIDPRGLPVLSISGEVHNISQEPRSVPSVVFAFLDQDGLELFDWATPMRSNVLQPGAKTSFASVVPAPPDAVRKVEVRFAKSRR